MLEESPEDLAKKIVDLEAQWDRWKEEKLKLEEEVMKVKSEEDRVMKKYMKMKGMYMEIREKFDSEMMKLKEENQKIREKYWEVEVKKRELTIDLEAALSQQSCGDEGATESQVECLTLKSLLEDRDNKIAELLGKIEALDRQNNRLERDFKDKMGLEAKKTKIEEEKNSKLIQKIQALERDKEQMLAEVSNLEKKKSEEVEKNFSLKKTLEAEKKRLVEVEGENFELGKNIEALDRQKDSAERDFNDKMALEAKKTKIEEDKNSKLIQKIQALERDKEQMVAEVSKLKKEKSEEVEKSFSLKKTLEVEKKRLFEVEGENFELGKKIEALYIQKDSLERCFKDNMVMEAKKMKVEVEENSKLIQALKRDKEQMVAEVLKLHKENSEEVEKSFSVKKALEAENKRLVEVEGENFRLAKKIEALDRQKDSVERDFKDKMAIEAKKTKMEEEKNSKLIQKIRALERDKEQMVAEVLKLKKEKSEEVGKSFSVKKALHAEKKISMEGEEKNSKLIQKIRASERDKEQMAAEVLKLKKEKSEEVGKNYSLKKALQAEKKISMEVEDENFELARKIKTLDTHNNSLLRDLKDKVALEAMKTQVEEKNSKLIQKIQALERDNEEMVAEVSKLRKEKSEEDSVKKALEAEKKRSAEVEGKNSELARKIAEMAHQAHLGSNVIGILGTPAAQIQGNIKIDAQTPLSSTERIKPLPGKLTGGTRSWERALPPP